MNMAQCWLAYSLRHLPALSNSSEAAAAVMCRLGHRHKWIWSGVRVSGEDTFVQSCDRSAFTFVTVLNIVLLKCL